MRKLKLTCSIHLKTWSHHTCDDCTAYGFSCLTYFNGGVTDINWGAAITPVPFVSAGRICHWVFSAESRSPSGKSTSVSRLVSQPPPTFTSDLRAQTHTFEFWGVWTAFPTRRAVGAAGPSLRRRWGVGGGWGAGSDFKRRAFDSDRGEGTVTMETPPNERVRSGNRKQSKRRDEGKVRRRPQVFVCQISAGNKQKPNEQSRVSSRRRLNPSLTPVWSCWD